jgi:hypothetical protein
VGVQHRLEFYGLKQLKNCFNSLNSTASFPFGTTKKISLKPVGVQHRLEFYGLKQLKNCFNALNSTAPFPFGTTKKILLKPVGVQHRQYFSLSSQERVGVRFPLAVFIICTSR